MVLQEHPRSIRKATTAFGKQVDHIEPQAGGVRMLYDSTIDDTPGKARFFWNLLAISLKLRLNGSLQKLLREGAE